MTNQHEYGSRPDHSMFGPSSLWFFAWSRSPLTLVLLHFAAVAVPCALAVWSAGVSAYVGQRMLVGSLALSSSSLVLIAGYWWNEAAKRRELVARWLVMLQNIIDGNYLLPRTEQEYEQFAAADSIIKRYPWLYHEKALKALTFRTLRMEWTNAAGDWVCLDLGRTITWCVTYAGGEHEAIPDDNGHWDYELDPPPVLMNALMLVAP